MFEKELLELEKEERWDKRHPDVIKAKKEYMEIRSKDVVILMILGLLMQLLRLI